MVLSVTDNDLHGHNGNFRAGGHLRVSLRELVMWSHLTAVTTLIVEMVVLGG